LSLLVATGDSVRDGVVESVRIGEGAVGELLLLEVAPASFDIVQLGGMLWQPFEGEPSALGEGAPCRLAAVDWCVVKDRDPGPGLFGGAELVEQGEEVGGALGRAGVHEQAPWGFSPRA